MKQKINYRLLFFGLTILLVSCTNSYEEGTERYNAKDSDIASIETEFEQIGYYKGDLKNRVFTFYINSTKTISRDSIPVGLWNAIEEHGLKQMHTTGKNTQSFYYLTKQKAPNVTIYKTYDAAMNKAYDQTPVAVVYTQFN